MIFCRVGENKKINDLAKGQTSNSKGDESFRADGETGEGARLLRAKRNLSSREKSRGERNPLKALGDGLYDWQEGRKLYRHPALN